MITPRRSPLRDFAGRPGVLGSFTADDTADAVKKAVAGAGRHVLLIDDLELLGADGELAEWVTDYVGELRDTGFDWLVPALREELVTALIRGLPKDQRRPLAPAVRAHDLDLVLAGEPGRGQERRPDRASHRVGVRDQEPDDHGR